MSRRRCSRHPQDDAKAPDVAALIHAAGGHRLGRLVRGRAEGPLHLRGWTRVRAHLGLLSDMHLLRWRPRTWSAVKKVLVFVLASPKSHTDARPSAESSMFWVLRSRCTTAGHRLSWQYCIASAMSSASCSSVPAGIHAGRCKLWVLAQALAPPCTGAGPPTVLGAHAALVQRGPEGAALRELHQDAEARGLEAGAQYREHVGVLPHRRHQLHLAASDTQWECERDACWGDASLRAGRITHRWWRCRAWGLSWDDGWMTLQATRRPRHTASYTLPAPPAPSSRPRVTSAAYCSALR